ncbi:GerMN domain-containing protein [Paeniglutamicibacter sp. NPDC012692]|uniref:GerMN domain-containing protein n=1 Tax=Paeniglutamicibacter sp. NPDC012692 TaxID=3364388 RepID=UPI003686DB0B
MSFSQKPAPYVTVLLTGLLGLALSGCSPAEPPAPGSASASQSPSDTASATPTPTVSASPSGPSASSIPSSAPASPSTKTAKLTVFYVAVDNQEGVSGPKIGCGDTLVATETGPVEFTNQVEAAINALLKDDSSTHGESGLKNAVAASNLKFKSSTVKGDQVTVNLTGTVMSGGTCDDPRIIEQLKYTAKVAAGVGSARILVNGSAIEDLLSQK